MGRVEGIVARAGLQDERRWCRPGSTTIPSIRLADRYSIVSTPTLAFAPTSAIVLAPTFHDKCDSEVRGRGAVSNNDWQVLFGLRAKF